MPDISQDDSKLKASYTPVSPDDDSSGGSPGVRRANNLPKVIAVVVIALVLTLVLWQIWGGGSGSDQPGAPEPKMTGEANDQSDMVSKMSGKARGIIAPDMPPKPQEEKQPAVMPEPKPAPKTVQQTAPAPAREVDQTRQRFEQMKLAAFQAAITSHSKVNFQTDAQPAASGNAGAGGQAYPSGSMNYADRLAAVQQAAAQGYADAGGGFGMAGASSGYPGSSGGGLDRMGMYRAGGTELLNRSPDASDKWTLSTQMQVPHSPYEVMTGTVIPATMITGINSDLPGQMVAQVSQNVYDTARGKHLIIPQGTKLIGQYSHSVAYGQERVLVAWNRLVFPDGKSLDIGAMPGATGAGYSGLKDQVNNHYLRVFGSAFLMSMITGGMVYGVDKFDDDDSNDDSISASDALAQALAVQIGQTALQLIQRNLAIAPTLEIRPGFRFNVVVTKDMVFSKPYQAFDY